MPRIRYRKTGNPLYENPPDFGLQDDNEELDESNDEGLFTTQPKGWWSSKNVLGSITNDQIRQILKNYREAIALLEQELYSRPAVDGRPSEQYSNLLGRQSEKMYYRTRKERKPSNKCDKYLRGLKLTRSQKSEILKTWTSLLEQYKIK